MIAVVIRSRRARGLHKELDLVERAGVLTVKLHLIGLLDWVLLHEHVLDQLLDHLGRDGRAVARVLQDERPWIFPVRLEPDLFSTSARMNRCI